MPSRWKFRMWQQLHQFDAPAAKSILKQELPNPYGTDNYPFPLHARIIHGYIKDDLVESNHIPKKVRERSISVTPIPT